MEALAGTVAKPIQESVHKSSFLHWRNDRCIRHETADCLLPYLDDAKVNSSFISILELPDGTTRAIVVASYPGLPVFFNVARWKIGKAWSIMWCNDDVWTLFGTRFWNLRPFTHAPASSSSVLAKCVAKFRRELTVDRRQGEKRSVVQRARSSSSNRLAMLVAMLVKKGLCLVLYRAYLLTIASSKADSITVRVGMNNQARW